MTGMQEAHVVLLSRLHWFLCTGLIVAESGTAVKQASDLHCSSGALGGREADERPSGQAVMAEKSIPPRRSASICMRCALGSRPLVAGPLRGIGHTRDLDGLVDRIVEGIRIPAAICVLMGDG